MTIAICTSFGFVVGYWIASFRYKSEIWRAEKEVRLSIQHARRAKFDQQRARTELQTDEILNERIKNA